MKFEVERTSAWDGPCPTTKRPLVYVERLLEEKGRYDSAITAKGWEGEFDSLEDVVAFMESEDTPLIIKRRLWSADPGYGDCAYSLEIYDSYRE